MKIARPLTISGMDVILFIANKKLSSLLPQKVDYLNQHGEGFTIDFKVTQMKQIGSCP